MSARAGRVVCDLTVALDGCAAGSGQSEERPFGDDGGDGRGGTLHGWMFEDAEENRAEIGARRPVTASSRSRAERPRSTGTSPSGWSTSCGCTSCR
nr:hypothetical protein [Actinospica acidiphila]